MGREEHAVEEFLIKQVERMGGICFKLTGYKGIADRLVILPNTPAFFVELKTEKGKESEAQKYMARFLASLGVNTYCINSKTLVLQLLTRYSKGSSNV